MGSGKIGLDVGCSRGWGRAGLLALLTVLLAVEGCRRAKQALEGPEKAPYQDAMTPLVTARRLLFMRWSNVSDFQPSVERFYKGRAYEPAWTHDGKLTEAAKGFIAAFRRRMRRGWRRRTTTPRAGGIGSSGWRRRARTTSRASMWR